MAVGKQALGSARGFGRFSDLAGGRAPQAYNSVVRERLSDIQRARILAAMFEVAAEGGASNVRVAHVVARCGVSRRTFYEIFADGEDCFLAAFEQALGDASERVLSAYDAASGWSEKIRAALIALLCFLDEKPAIGRVLIVESLSGGSATLECRNRVVAELAEAIEQGRDHAKSGAPILPLAGEGVLGGVLMVIHSRLMEERTEPLVALTNPLMGMIVLPYLGSAAARRELERPLTVRASSQESVMLRSDPFKDAGMRLTYRTVRVLMAVAEHPGTSNRVIGDTAEIKDQGQISKLLGRLERIGIVCNMALGPGQGAPNAWTLTESGRQVVRTVRAHTERSIG